MKVAILTALSGMLFLGVSMQSLAETNRWAGYTGVDTQRDHIVLIRHNIVLLIRSIDLIIHSNPIPIHHIYPYHQRPVPQWGQPHDS